MTWSHLHLSRVMHLARRPRGAHAAAAQEADGAAYRRLALGELDFSPVHGRHCICARCEQLADRRR